MKQNPKINSNLIVGSRGCGKSTLVKELLHKSPVKKENRFLISPTALLDNTLTHEFYPENIFTQYEDGLLDGILNIIQNEHHKQSVKVVETPIGLMEVPVKNPKLSHYLICMDDCLGAGIRNNSKINFFFTRHRHYKVHLYYTTQNYKSIPPIVRNNCVRLYVFNVRNNEKQKIYDEHGKGDKKEFYKQLDDLPKYKHLEIFYD